MQVSGFTNVHLGPFGIDHGLFCSYHHPGAHDNAPAVRAASLSAAGGGALALRGVTQIRAALDIDACTMILGASEGGRWSFATKPDLVADPSVAAGIALMTWWVADIEVAAAVLAGLGARRDGDAFTIAALGGLEIGLTEVLPIRPNRRGS